MNKFHDFLEQYTLTLTKQGILDDVKSAICFYMPKMQEIAFFEQEPQLFRLPYEVCWFEGEFDAAPSNNPTRKGTIKVAFLAKTNSSNGFYFELFVKIFPELRDQGWIRWGHVSYDSSNWELNPVDGTPPDTEKLMGFCVGYLAVFLTVLNCANVRRIKHDPPEALQKARSRRGRLPLFSFWTLDISLARDEQAKALGGSHASPRLHLRRGHSREHHSGKWCWVNPHTVGNKKLGIVHKDYNVNSIQEGMLTE